MNTTENKTTLGEEEIIIDGTDLWDITHERQTECSASCD